MSKRPSHVARLQSDTQTIPNARTGGVKPLPGEPRLQDPTVTEWNDLGGAAEAPPGNGQVVDEVPQNDDAKQDQIRVLLNRQLATDETPPAEDAPAEPAAAAPAPAAAPTRRERLDGLDAKVEGEKQRLALERQLGEERKRREAAEAAAADPIAAARARGMTVDQILDLALAEPGEKPPAAPAIPAEVDKRLTAIEQRERDLQRREALGVVESLTKDLDIPVVRATNRVTVTDGQGGSRVMSGRELVLETAKRLWEQEGSPAGQQHAYIAKAAPLVEEQLVEDQRPAFEAYASKRGAKVDPPKPTVPPTLGRRTGGSAPNAPAAPTLPEDDHERREAIKRRMGW